MTKFTIKESAGLFFRKCHGDVDYSTYVSENLIALSLVNLNQCLFGYLRGLEPSPKIRKNDQGTEPPQLYTPASCVPSVCSLGGMHPGVVIELSGSG